jgi:hypothetical protein
MSTRMGLVLGYLIVFGAIFLPLIMAVAIGLILTVAGVR